MSVALQILAYLAFTLPSYLPQIWDATATARLNARMAAMRAAGDPTTMEELARRVPEPPQGRNAATFYNAAFQKMDALGGALDAIEGNVPIVGEPDLPPPGVVVAPAMLQAIERYLATAKPIFEPLDKATDLEHCKFALDFAKGMELELAHLSKLRQAARLYALQAVFHTEKGNAAEAAASLARCLRVGEAVREEPILISALVRVACHGIAVAQIERAVARVQFPDAALLRLGERLAAVADPKIITDAMLGERCFGMDIYRRHVLGDKAPGLLNAMGGAPVPFDLAIRFVPRAYFKSDMVVYIDLMTAYVDAARKPYPQSVIEGAQVGADLDRKIPRYYVVSRMILPALGRVFSTGQRHMALCDSARVALACLRYRSKHGRLPATLAALAPDFLPALPPDPYTAKDLAYRRDANGFVVYALGENKADDGGKTERGDGRDYPDVGFRVRWPKAEF